MPFLNSFNAGIDRLGSLFGDPQLPQGGVMGEPQVQQAYNPKLAMAAQLLAGSNSGRGFNEIFSQALMAGQQARQQQQQAIAQQRAQQTEDQLRQAQIQKLQQPEQGPASVQEYEYAKRNGFQGTFEDFLATGHVQSTPADLQVMEWYKKATPEERAMYDKLNGRQQSPYFQWVQRVLPDGSTQQGTFNARTGSTTWDQAVVPAGEKPRADARGTAIGGAEGAQAGKAPAKASLDYVLGEFRKQLPETIQGGAFGIVGKAGSVFDYKDASRFDNLREQLSTELRTVFRIPGEGTLSDQEQKQYGLQLPSRNLAPDINSKVLNDIEQRVKLRTETPMGPWRGSNPAPVDVEALLNKYAPNNGGR